MKDNNKSDPQPTDYELGFQACLAQDPCDLHQTSDWQRGWFAAELALELKPGYLKGNR